MDVHAFVRLSCDVTGTRLPVNTRYARRTRLREVHGSRCCTVAPRDPSTPASACLPFSNGGGNGKQVRRVRRASGLSIVNHWQLASSILSRIGLVDATTRATCTYSTTAP